MRPPGYWQEKAEKLRAELEASSALVTRPAMIKRRAVVRWNHKNDGTRCEEYVPREQLKAFFRNLERNGIRQHSYRRIWVVCEENPFSTEPHEIQRWDNLCMALAMREARNFLHAKWLMTGDMDALTNELSGGARTRR